MSRPRAFRPTGGCSGTIPVEAASLVELVEHYRRRFRPNRAKHDERYRSMAGLRTAIEQAALARREDGTCEPHQRRIGLRGLRPFERSLQRVRQRVEACRSFDELLQLVRERRTPGIGELTVYDTATRIGAFMRLAPEVVYLHAGTRVGARALGLSVEAGVIEMSELPRPLRGLSPSEVEDFLCIYKDQLGGFGVESATRSRGVRRGRRSRTC